MSDISVTRRVLAARTPPSADLPHVLPLTPLDLTITVMPLEMWYVFDEAVPFDRLADGLRKTLRLLPRFSGRHATVPGGELEGTRISSDDSMELVEARADFTFKDLGDFDDPDNLFNNAVLTAPFIEPSLDPPLQVTPDAPVAKAQVTYLRDHGMLLSLRIHHCVADGEGHVGFARTWAALTRGHQPPVVCDARDSLLAHFHGVRAPEAPEPLAEDAPVAMSISAYLRDGGMEWFMKPAEIRGFDISLETIGQAKRRFASSLPAQQVESLTTNDIVHAHLWSAILRVRKRRGTLDGLASLWQAANLRARLTLDPGFLGNAVLPYPSVVDPDEIGDADPANLAVILRRRLVQSMAADRIRSRLLALASVHHRGVPWLDLMYLPRYHRGEISSTNWTRFAFGEVDFGSGSPQYAGTGRRTPAAGLFFVQALPPNREPGVRVLVGLHSDEMNDFVEEFELSAAD